MIGTGFGDARDPAAAVAAAVSTVGSALGGERPSWVMAFASGRHDPHVIFEAIRHHLGPIPVVGGAAFGSYTADGFGFGGHECALAVFGEGEPTPSVHAVSLDQDALGAGRQLGQRAASAVHPGDTGLLFYDFIRTRQPFTNYVAQDLLDGLAQSIDPERLPMFGGATLGDLRFSSSFVFGGDRAIVGGAVLATLPAARWAARHVITHGCSPVSLHLEVTGAEGCTITHLDGRPALDVLVEIAAVDASQMPGLLERWMAIGEVHGDPYAPYAEGHYVNYLVRDADPEARSLTLTERAPALGARIQIMARDQRSIVEAARAQAGRFVAAGPPVAFTLSTHCAGRITPFASADVAARLARQRSLPGPRLGFFSASELAPVGGRTRPMNWTEVTAGFGQLDG